MTREEQLSTMRQMQFCETVDLPMEESDVAAFASIIHREFSKYGKVKLEVEDPDRVFPCGNHRWRVYLPAAVSIQKGKDKLMNLSLVTIWVQKHDTHDRDNPSIRTGVLFAAKIWTDGVYHTYRHHYALERHNHYEPRRPYQWGPCPKDFEPWVKSWADEIFKTF